MNKLLIALVVSGFLLNGSCNDGNRNQKVLTKEVKFTKEGELTLKKADTDSLIVTLDIEIADTDYETQTGLMYRKNMEEQRGMLFIFEDERIRSFYMKNTQFALDIIYLDGDGKVVSLYKNAKPFDQSSLASKEEAKYVLEVNGGLTDKWGLAKGDVMEFTRTNNQ